MILTFGLLVFIGFGLNVKILIIMYTGDKLYTIGCITGVSPRVLLIGF